MNTRILYIILASVLLLAIFGGCGSDDSMSPPEQDEGNGELVPISLWEDGESTETEPDYSWFGFQEETNRLTVYSNEDNLKSVLDPAIRIFREKYPEVEVDYRIYGKEEYNERIRAELPIGRGPYLIVLDEATLSDLYKAMTTGIFEDLNPYFAEDKEIDLAEFLMPVMDGGIMNGKGI